MTNPITAEQYLISRIEKLETEVDAYKADSEAWKTNYYAVREELEKLIDAIQSIGKHEYSVIYSCGVVDAGRAVQKYDHEAYAVLSKYFSPVPAPVTDDKASEAEASEA